MTRLQRVPLLRRRTARCFPAMEDRLDVREGDLAYLANLCHNCGECLYACQYAPPHEFGINVPRTLAELRLASYEEYCWPRGAGRALFRRQARVTLGLAAGLTVVLLAIAVIVWTRRLWPAQRRPAISTRSFPHGVMVALFGAGGRLFVRRLALVGAARSGSGATSGFGRSTRPDRRGRWHALARRADAATPARRRRRLHERGRARSPWRRWFHHCTFYGFALCFASTTVAAIYHVVFGWRAPYAYGSLPVVLGTLGGAGLLVGPAGLFALRERRDRALVRSGAGRTGRLVHR